MKTKRRCETNTTTVPIDPLSGRHYILEVICKQRHKTNFSRALNAKNKEQSLERFCDRVKRRRGLRRSTREITPRKQKVNTHDKLLSMD